MQRVRRSRLLALIAAAVVLFLFISALLARAFSVDGAERSAITDLIQAEARGNSQAMTTRISGCATDAACRARAAANAAALRRAGTVSIAQLQSSAGFSLTGSVGTARVAWVAGSSLPIVQCVRVRRAGDVLAGFRIELLRISVRIKSDADCPASF
jgi:hypothetical protein